MRLTVCLLCIERHSLRNFNAVFKLNFMCIYWIRISIPAPLQSIQHVGNLIIQRGKNPCLIVFKFYDNLYRSIQLLRLWTGCLLQPRIENGQTSVDARRVHRAALRLWHDTNGDVLRSANLNEGRSLIILAWRSGSGDCIIYYNKSFFVNQLILRDNIGDDFTWWIGNGTVGAYHRRQFEFRLGIIATLNFFFNVYGSVAKFSRLHLISLFDNE